MPQNNRFQHQNYPTQPTVAPEFHKLTVGQGSGVDFSLLHTALGVREVVVVHGTFMGDDPFGVVEVLASVGDAIPPLKNAVHRLTEKVKAAIPPFTERVTGDVGNYTVEFRDEFQRLVGGDPPVQLLEPKWSGQNHHFARADLAVRLLCHLDDLQPTTTDRILLWGHSHAGNGFAILSNLLANDRTAVDRFFDACGKQQPDHWLRAKRILARAPAPHPWAQSILIATFGTPVRYGWDCDGYHRLIHVSHHRNYDPANPIVGHPMFPPHHLPDILKAKYGDWVQSFAIAGTDVSAVTSLTRNKNLSAVLESGLRPPEHGLDTRLILTERIRDACARWKTGTRCHADGRNLLVEYEPSGRNVLAIPVEDSMFGHGVSTAVNWLPSHLSLVQSALMGD